MVPPRGWLVQLSSCLSFFFSYLLDREKGRDLLSTAHSAPQMPTTADARSREFPLGLPVSLPLLPPLACVGRSRMGSGTAGMVTDVWA